MVEKLVVVIMGQNCEKFLPMCLESVKDADKIIYMDGGSSDQSKDLALTFDTTNEESVTVLESNYDQNDPKMNGRQRNRYLNYVKEKYPNWYCLCLDADEVLDTDGIRRIKEFLNKNETME